MTDPRSIIFQAHEICAALEGRKTQLRAPTKPQFFAHASVFRHETPPTNNHGIWCDGHGVQIRCPYGAPGDLLWVRETWNGDWCDRVIYRADGGSAREAGYPKEPKWRAPATMPREACRLWLRVTAVRVERLQEITGSDLAAMGVEVNVCQVGFSGAVADVIAAASRRVFAEAWDAVYAETGPGWEANPWVWAIEFERAPKPEGA